MKDKSKLEITAGHLYALSVLYNHKEPVSYQRFVPDMNPIIDLTEWGLASKREPDTVEPDDTNTHYFLTEFGRKYCEALIKSASRILNRHLKPF